MASQSVRGDKNVQIQHVHGSTIQVTYNQLPPRAVPLERATVPVSPNAKSPARLVRARSGVVPFAARRGLRDELTAWLGTDTPFASAVIAGGGGSGKTRLAVEICEWAERAGWLCGLLTQIADQASLETLAEAPIARLVVLDYSESRAEQVELLLPLLAARATEQEPVRVLLLVRASPRRTADWTESLRNRSDRLDALLDECDVRVLEDLPLEQVEREELFQAAAGALAQRAGTTVPPLPEALLEGATFANPLLVVLAAYLAVQGDQAPPASRIELLHEVLLHEERYWRSSAGDLFDDDALPRRIVALVTLVAADSEAEAVERLRLLPDLADAPTERLGVLARWARSQYPGSGWWNPLEPDLVGEQLVADTLSDQPAVLSGALTAKTPKQLTRPLEVYGRAAANHPELAAALQSILSVELVRLCEAAVAQASNEADHELLYGKSASVAGMLDSVLNTVEVDWSSLPIAVDTMPAGANLILNPLAVTLSFQLVTNRRRLAADDSAHEHELAGSLNNLSIRLGEAGRREEGLAAIEECIQIRRRLVAANPTSYEPDLAGSLNNLSVDLSDAGRREEGLTAIEECVEIYRRLAADDPKAYEPDLATSLNNLAVDLAKAGRRGEGLAAIEECVEIYRRLAADDPKAYEPGLAMAFNTLSNRLGEAGRSEECLAAIEECVGARRRLAATNPAAHEPDLASSLNNFSIRLGEAGRREEGLAAIKECVEIRRRLAAASPVAHEPDLAASLNNLSNRLGEAGSRDEGLAAIKECVEIYRRLAAASPAAHEPDLALSLNNLSLDLAYAGHREEGLAAIEESVQIRRRLAAADPAHEPDLAVSLTTLSNHLGEAGRREESERAHQEAADIRNNGGLGRSSRSSAASPGYPGQSG